MMSGEVLAYAIGAAALFVIQKMGWFPVLTPAPGPGGTPAVPAPVTPPPPAVDEPLAEFLPWLTAAKAGQIRLDDQDWEYLELVRAALAGLPPRAKP